MLKELRLENFKAQKQADIEFGGFNVLTGNNAAGKTTCLQALVFIKQSLSRGEVVFNDYLLKLGDFKEVVHTHDADLTFGIQCIFDFDGTEAIYYIRVSEHSTAEQFFLNGELAWQWDSSDIFALEPGGRIFLGQAAKGHGGGDFTNPNPEFCMSVVEYMRKVVEWFENMLYLSSSRGFTKYSYPLLAGQPTPDEVAKRAGDAGLLEEWLSNLIMYRINEARRYPKMREQLDIMRERLSRVGVDINPYVMDGPSVVIDLSEGDMWVSAVNSGYGINQMVSFVALGTLLPEGTLVCVEEPEIHLHPKTQRIVCEILAEIAAENKQVIITSHSDHMLKTLGRVVDEKKLDVEDVKVYNFVKGTDHVTRGREVDITDEQAIEELFQ